MYIIPIPAQKAARLVVVANGISDSFAGPIQVRSRKLGMAFYDEMRFHLFYVFYSRLSLSKSHSQSDFSIHQPVLPHHRQHASLPRSACTPPPPRPITISIVYCICLQSPFT